MTQITSGGDVISAEISPDGNHVAYVTVVENGGQAMWLRQLAGGSALELLPRRPVAFWGHTFSTDGARILFGLTSREEPGGAIHEIPALGGAPRRILDGNDSTPGMSSDGKRIAWLRAGYPTRGENALLVANADGSDPKVLARRHAPERFVPIFYAGPSWSPDGTRIATSVVDEKEGRIVALRLDGGPEEIIAAGFTQCSQVAWLPEGDRLVAIASSRKGDSPQVWLVPSAPFSREETSRGTSRSRQTGGGSSTSRLSTDGPGCSGSREGRRVYPLGRPRSRDAGVLARRRSSRLFLPRSQGRSPADRGRRIGRERSRTDPYRCSTRAGRSCGGGTSGGMQRGTAFSAPSCPATSPTPGCSRWTASRRGR